MYEGHRIGVIVPAHNEQRLILETLRGMPEWIDEIYVIDDGSKDRTSAIVERQRETDRRIHLLQNKRNRGLGATLIRGYRACLKRRIDIGVVMAGDNQMDPAHLPDLLAPIISEKAEYVKGGREKLVGTALGAFGGFLQEDWREHDMMWGRLDGAERIITALLPESAHKDLRNKLSAPPGLKPLHIWQMIQRPAWCLNMLTTRKHEFRNIVGHVSGVTDTSSLFDWVADQFDPRLSWDDVEWVKSQWQGPLILKGILDTVIFNIVAGCHK